MSFLKKVIAWHSEDDLMGGITFKELIDTVHANESTKDAASVTRTFENILQANLEDARSLLRQHMKDILTELK